MSTSGEREGAWSAEVPITDSIVLPPHPHFLDALGGNHRLETALADLVDNSIDARATQVSMRFFIVGNRVSSLEVVDNGDGMSPTDIDGAMTFGNVRDYGPDELGHFGLGLKAASFSQAESLSVISQASGSVASGRRWLMSKATESYECDVIAEDFCQTEFARHLPGSASGTIVRWDDIRTFPEHEDPDMLMSFLHDTSTRLQQHLGLVFHRFLADNRLTVTIDFEDAVVGAVGAPISVRPLDPFAYPRTGATDYPKQLVADVGGGRFSLTCHIWPGRSQLPQFRLPLQSVENYQGFYFYRRGRLLQAGGWNALEVSRRDLQLARIVVEIDETLLASSVLRMNPEKSRVETSHEFSAGVNRARADDGTSFRDYLTMAGEQFKRSNQRQRVRSSVVPVGRGVPPRLRQVVHHELPTVPGAEPVDLRSRREHDLA
jgi:hypothetical protein